MEKILWKAFEALLLMSAWIADSVSGVFPLPPVTGEPDDTARSASTFVDYWNLY